MLGSCKWKPCYMKFIFVDAENVGIRRIKSIQTDHPNRVYVFSNEENIRKVCQEKGFVFFTNYEYYYNQADFYIIAVLVEQLLLLTKEQIEASVFLLYSEDKALNIAFENQLRTI